MVKDFTHPQEALHEPGFSNLVLPSCDHYAGSERFIKKAFDLQRTLPFAFDVTCDCEDGAKIGDERAQADLIARCLSFWQKPALGGRAGVRVHPISHPAVEEELDILLKNPASLPSYITFPKSRNTREVIQALHLVNEKQKHYSLEKEIPLHILIETPQALQEVELIASLSGIESLEFGLLDFISEFSGAIPEECMTSPGQFENNLIRNAKTNIAFAALKQGLVPAHNISLAIDNPQAVLEDATRARKEFGFLRMWSIHPSQIPPIVQAMQPQHELVTKAASILLEAEKAHWAPIKYLGQLQDRASYRYYWGILRRAKLSGVAISDDVTKRWFSDKSC